MSILDPNFRYVQAAATDIRKTFARIRKEQREREAANRLEAEQKVSKLQRRAK